MQSVDYNIEFAHIYSDQKFGNEQEKSIEVLSGVINDLQSQGKSFVTTVLIDEYNPKTCVLNENDFVNKIKSFGIPLDFVAYESKLSEIVSRLIADLPKSNLEVDYLGEGKHSLFLKTENKKHKLRENFGFSHKNTCALLTSCWLLCRLGVYRIPDDAVRRFGEKAFEAKKLITVLPEKYKNSEDKALKIIKASGRKEILKNIEYRFF